VEKQNKYWLKHIFLFFPSRFQNPIALVSKKIVIQQNTIFVRRNEAENGYLLFQINATFSF
jgi:hypothetical protein